MFTFYTELCCLDYTRQKRTLHFSLGPPRVSSCPIAVTEAYFSTGP